MEIFPTWLRKEWNIEEPRVLVLLSLMCQVFLILLATRRKKTVSRSLSLALWSLYLSADFVATLALGNLLRSLKNDSSGNCGSSSSSSDLLAFWSPFLLLHLGGPDTIAAYSVEDNELWYRHLLTLIFQVVTAVAIFPSLPSRMWAAAIPVYFAGCIKYVERTLALRSASMSHLMDSMIPPPDPGPNYAKFMEEYASQQDAGLLVEIHAEAEPKPIARSDLGVVEVTVDDTIVVSEAYLFFKTFKRLIVDLILSFHDRADSQSSFLRRSSRQAFQIIEIELSFAFDILFTKSALVHTLGGVSARCTCLGMILVSLTYFCLLAKGGYKGVEIIISYVLLVGALSLEMISILLLVFSDWTNVWLEDRRKQSWIAKQIFIMICRVRPPTRPRWSNRMSQYNLLTFSLRDQPTWKTKILTSLGVKESWDNLWYTDRVQVSDTLKDLIFNELKEKAESVENSTDYKRFNTCRGERALQLKGYLSYLGWSIQEAELDESILLWHIATDICYYTDHQGDSPSATRETCREISNYMLYLLVQQPFMLTAGIGKIRFGDTCAEAKKFLQEVESEILDEVSALPAKRDFWEDSKLALATWLSLAPSKSMSMEEACEMLLEVKTEVPPVQLKGDRSKSVLFDACRLAKNLRELGSEKQWSVMSSVWVEMLCFAAIHCKGNVHAKQLSFGGGELLTHVWFLIAHLGMGEHYRIEAGHARAKLIVDK